MTVGGRWTAAVSPAEWLRLAVFGAAVAALHAAGWGLFLFYPRGNPAMAGLGTLAYTFGLRHAFDADHIAAIDNTTRKLLQDGQRPLGVGFFFSLGHSTIVFSLAAGLGDRGATVRLADPRVPGLRRLRRRERVGDVPVDHRHPQPDRAGRHRADLLRACAAATYDARAARAAAARPRA